MTNPINNEENFGDKLVGRSFNPSQSTQVDLIKELTANLANLVWYNYANGKEKTLTEEIIFSKCISAILDAQMTAVKIITSNLVDNSKETLKTNITTNQ